MFNQWLEPSIQSLDQSAHIACTFEIASLDIQTQIKREKKKKRNYGFCVASQSGYSKADTTHFKPMMRLSMSSKIKHTHRDWLKSTVNVKGKRAE